MTAKKAGSQGQRVLFGALLEDFLNSSPPLFGLAERIEWQRFETEFGVHFADHAGRPPLPTRLMVGLEYLKYIMRETTRLLPWPRTFHANAAVPSHIAGV